MIDKNKEVKVINRYSGTVGYDIPDLGNLHRNFYPHEQKTITYEELFKLASDPAGARMLKHYLVIKDYEVIKDLFGEVEPEYFYTEDDIKELMSPSKSLDAFLDCLDYAPDGVLDIVKRLAVDLPLNDINKRNAIKNKLNFNVDAAIRIKETKYDGDSDSNFDKTDESVPKRRVAKPDIKADEAESAPKRRVVIANKE